MRYKKGWSSKGDDLNVSESKFPKSNKSGGAIRFLVLGMLCLLVGGLFVGRNAISSDPQIPRTKTEAAKATNAQLLLFATRLEKSATLKMKHFKKFIRANSNRRFSRCVKGVKIGLFVRFAKFQMGFKKLRFYVKKGKRSFVLRDYMVFLRLDKDVKKKMTLALRKAKRCKSLYSQRSPEPMAKTAASPSPPVMSAPPRKPSPSIAPPKPSKSRRRSRRMKKMKMKSKRARRPARAYRQSVEADGMREGEQGVGGARHRGLSKREEKKKGGKAQKPQVWQRTKQNTVLSKVSVGGGKYLILKKLRVSVQVEGMRVRTIIDHIYHNPFNRTLQGTFKYTLPPESSVSYYAMFVGQAQRRTPTFFEGKGPDPRTLNRMGPQKIVRTSPGKNWGKLREARLVPSEQGRQVYEKITRRRIDPALLEQDAPNTFTGRVFPIPAKGYNRVIIAYEETLPQLQAKHIYRFRFPPDVADMIDFTMSYNPKVSKISATNLKALRCQMPKKKAFVRCYWEQNKPKKDAVFTFKPKDPKISSIAGMDPLDGKKYLLSQVRVDLPDGIKKHAAEQAVFLLDTSLSANPDLFAAHVALLRQILNKNASLKRFNVLFFDVGAIWANPKGWIENNKAARKKLFARIDKIVLEGATDFSAAMKALARPSWLAAKDRKKLNLDTFVLSDGLMNWGNLQVEQILYQFGKKKLWKQVRFFTYQMGIGSENLGFFRRLVRKGGALFPCLGRKELPRCATAHTKAAMLLEDVQIKGIKASQILVAGRQTSIYPGALITIASRFEQNGTAQILLKGQYQGKLFAREYTSAVKAEGDLGPRAWAELAIAQLLELEDPALRKLIVAYSQHFRIPNKYCSYLILETDKEYKLYGLEKALKTKKVEDVAKFIEKILLSKAAPISERQRWIALLKRAAKKFKMLGKSSGRSLLTLLRTIPAKDFQFSEVKARKLWLKDKVSAAYLKQRLKSRDDFAPFVKEAKKRLYASTSGAIRSLSCIIELHPSNPQALRLSAYYMLSWKKPGLAARMFLRVLERRSFEPHAYRDLARSLILMKRYALAAALYEVMLAGSWHSRFGQFKKLASEEYALLLFDALRQKKMNRSMRRFLSRRKMMLGLTVRPSKLRVTVTWNTDNTDIDLWVTGPSKQRCYYRNKSTSDGGRLLEDITRGYGPERYENRSGTSGLYHVQLNFYGHRTNVLGNETHVSVMIVRNAGSSNQKIILKNLVLKKRKQVVSVARVKF